VHSRFEQALACYESALKARPDQARTLNNLAWLRATCPDVALRNGTEALNLATRACELTTYGKPLYLGTLAQAYREAGDLPAAIATAEKEAALASSLNLG